MQLYDELDRLVQQSELRTLARLIRGGLVPIDLDDAIPGYGAPIVDQGYVPSRIIEILTGRDQPDRRPSGVCPECYSEWRRRKLRPRTVRCEHQHAAAHRRTIRVRDFFGKVTEKRVWAVTQGIARAKNQKELAQHICPRCLPVGGDASLVVCRHRGTAAYRKRRTWRVSLGLTQKELATLKELAW
ncbi:MAG TPA: hypothetical protein VFB37_07615 [Steroidobacteraceae bacterium]|nr:hypothetical protein [Steroidobacteraceae bacterium]